MVRRSIFTHLRPNLRRLILFVILMVVLWISTRIIICLTLYQFQHRNVSNYLRFQSQQHRLHYNATKRLYPSGFNYSNSKLCPENGANVKLLILITSPPISTHRENRKSIRNTWRHFALSLDGRQDIVIGFMMGIESTEKDKRENFKIKQEINIFDDIIIGNYVDSYDNLTLKTLSMLEWALTYCSQAKYLLKTDDDMWINIPKLLNFTESLVNDRDNHSKIYGSLLTNTTPEIDMTSKYFVSIDDYPQKYYPCFVAGPAYLLPRNTWQSLYLEGPRTKFLKLEDVFFTGIVADKLSIQRVNVTNFLMNLWQDWRWNDAELNTQVATTIAASLKDISNLNHIWNAYTNSSGSYGNCSADDDCKTKLFADALFQVGQFDNLFDSSDFFLADFFPDDVFVFMRILILAIFILSSVVLSFIVITK